MILNLEKSEIKKNLGIWAREKWTYRLGERSLLQNWLNSESSWRRT